MTFKNCASFWNGHTFVSYFSFKCPRQEGNLYPPIFGDVTKVLRERADYIMHQKNVNYGL